MAKNCRGCEDPQTQNTGVECNGNFVSDECVVLAEDNVYFNLPQGSKLSQLVSKITNTFKAFHKLVAKKIDYTTLEVYTDDVEASLDGVEIGEPYKTPDGFVKVRMS